MANPGHEESSWTYQTRPLISPPPGFPLLRRAGGDYLRGRFPEYAQVPIIWMPKDVSISAFTAEPGVFALGCDDGRLMIGHVPPALAT